MFDTLKLIYTQDEALELVSRYEKVYNEKIKELEEENRKLKKEYDNFKKKVSDDMKEIAKYQLENIGLFDKLEQENKKLKDDFMKMLYVYHNMPATSNEIAILVKEQYSKWYDDIKSEMRRQIMKEIGVKH